MDVTELENGNLELSADKDTREEIAERLEEYGFHQVLAELFEPYYTNGGYEPFDAGQANPFVGLTEAPCIAESMDVHDDGRREIVGRFWYYPGYMLRCPLEELAETGRTVFTLAR